MKRTLVIMLIAAALAAAVFVACETEKERIVREIADAERARALEVFNAAILVAGSTAEAIRADAADGSRAYRRAAYIAASRTKGNAFVAASKDYEATLAVIDAYEAAWGDFDAAEKALYKSR